ncbi:MAG: hypothetical protein U9Q74_08395 [Gemmatimonadota bacterium]|nr:hypothetical protein [Gemmatimonadota bacterium]
MTRAVRVALRNAAIAIAVLAFVDPVFVRQQADRATVSVTGDGPLAARVRAALAGQFDVVAGFWPGADALVVADGPLPAAAMEWRGPAFAVAAAGVTFERVVAPRRAGTDAVVPVDVSARVRGAAGREVTFTARAGDVAVDRLTRRAASDDERMTFTLAAPAPAPGAVPIRVEATAGGAVPPAAADVAVNVEPTPWRVLFHDARPSWMSTFVRRALERDTRFRVASRIATSSGVASATASAGRLATAGDAYDLIVVGAPQALDAREVAALDDFTRRRGGSVVLLLDDADAGPAARLAGLPSAGGGLREAGGPVAITFAGADHTGPPELVAAEFAWPAALEPGAEPVVTAVASVRGDSARRPVLWTSPNGAGRVVVSGALDAWRFRDASRSRFDEFWRTLLAREAARALPPLEVRAEPAVARPGERVRVSVTLRDLTLAAVAQDGPVAASASVRAELLGTGAPAVPLRVLPGASPGQGVATLRAPAEPTAQGAYRIRVTASGATAEVPLVVRRDAAAPAGERADAVAAWVASRGGAVIAEGELGGLGARIAGAVQLPARARPGHPMRSPWWLVAFTLALSGEWYLRRRRSLP